MGVRWGSALHVESLLLDRSEWGWLQAGGRAVSLAPSSVGPRAGRISTQGEAWCCQMPSRVVPGAVGSRRRAGLGWGLFRSPRPQRRWCWGRAFRGPGAHPAENGERYIIRQNSAPNAPPAPSSASGVAGQPGDSSAFEGWRWEGAGGRRKEGPEPSSCSRKRNRRVDLVCISFLSLPHRLPQRRGIQQHPCTRSHAVGRRSCPAWPGSLPRAGMRLPRSPKAQSSYETRRKLEWREARK